MSASIQDTSGPCTNWEIPPKPLRPNSLPLPGCPLLPGRMAGMVARAGSAPGGVQCHGELPHGARGSEALANTAWQGSLASGVIHLPFVLPGCCCCCSPGLSTGSARRLAACEQWWWQAWQTSLLHGETLLPSDEQVSRQLPSVRMDFSKTLKTSLV